MISVVILGAGNVGSHLFKACEKAPQVQVIQWYNRHLEQIVSYQSQVAVTDSLAQLLPADIYILALSDSVVADVSAQLPFENRLVVHTSGSLNSHVLDKKNRRGVLYPLQTFSKTVPVNFKQVPMCIETLDKADYPLVKHVAQQIGGLTKRVNSERRASLHLAAVFVNNFTNQLYRIGHEITEAAAVDFDLLKPLILETAKKIQSTSPYRAQTGPAVRNNQNIIKKHLKLLENEDYRSIYQLLTHSIQKTHGNKKL